VGVEPVSRVRLGGRSRLPKGHQDLRIRREPGNPAESGPVLVRIPGRSDIARDPDEGGPEVFEGIPEGSVVGVVPPVSEGPAEPVDGLPVVGRMDADVDGRTGVVGSGAEARDGQQRGQEDSTGGRSPGSIPGKLSLTREHDSTGNRRQNHSPLRRPTDQPVQCSRLGAAGSVQPARCSRLGAAGSVQPGEAVINVGESKRTPSGHEDTHGEGNGPDPEARPADSHARANL